MERWYDAANGKTTLVYGDAKANVSSPSDSEYLMPYRKTPNQLGYDGLIWKMAHYLSPIRIDQFLITSTDGHSIETSPIYQNPYWPTVADEAALK